MRFQVTRFEWFKTDNPFASFDVQPYEKASGLRVQRLEIKISGATGFMTLEFACGQGDETSALNFIDGFLSGIFSSFNVRNIGLKHELSFDLARTSPELRVLVMMAKLMDLLTVCRVDLKRIHPPHVFTETFEGKSPDDPEAESEGCLIFRTILELRRAALG